MRALSSAVILLIAALHLYFLVLEMFLWTTPLGLKTFGMTAEVARSSAVLAANQGLYNGFLAAGLVWGLLRPGRGIKRFFLACVLVAGVFGGLTAKPSILLVQALPAAVALLLLWLSRRGEGRRE
jgi:putative membrane protein